MRLGNLITGALMLKLLAKAVKNSRENGRDILNDNNGSRRQRKNSGEGAGESKMPGVPKAAPSPENAPKRAEKSSSLPAPFRPIPAKPDTDVPDHFTPYEGADMTCAEADAAGFEFIGSDKYHGIDWYLCYQYKDILRIGSYGSKGIKACVITGWHGSGTIVKVPRTINGRPVVSIEREAFKGSPIDEIYLPDTVLIINEMAFMKSALTYARLSENLYSIMDRAFCGCNLLERVYLGNVSHIGKQAFYDCKALSEIRLPDSVNRIDDGAFQGSFLRKIYWKDIAYTGDNVVAATPFSAKNDCVILGGTLQKCTVSNVDVIMIDDPQVNRIGAEAFCRAKAKKVIFTENVRTVGTGAFNTYMQRLTAVIAPGAHNFGDYCFANVDRVTVSDTEHFTIEEHSFKGTNMETSYAIDGSGYYCVTVRNTLAFVGEDYAERIHHGILTLSGDTLVMDGSVHFTAAKRIPCLGMKKLLLSENLKQLYSFHSIEEFEEIIFRSSRLTVREIIPYRPKKSVTLRFKFNCGLWKVDSAVLLYLPNVVKGSAEAERLCALYGRCLKCAPFTYDPFFKFDLYDSEILNLVSSYRARFTIARMRLEGEYELSPEARERYENFLLSHKRKAEFTAKKHGDTALLSLFEKLSEKNNDPKGDPQK